MNLTELAVVIVFSFLAGYLFCSFVNISIRQLRRYLVLLTFRHKYIKPYTGTGKKRD